jgi:hypothetical protein
MSKPAVAEPDTPVEPVAKPAVPKARAPRVKTYDVFVEVDGPKGVPARDIVAVEVSSVLRRDDAARRDAIKTATEGLPEDEQYGTFWTVPSGTMVKDTRSLKVEQQDVWS